MQQPISDQTLTYRVEMLERRVQQLQSTTENELQLRTIRDDIKDIKDEVKFTQNQLVTMTEKQGLQDIASQNRDAELREALNKLQIRVLTYVVVTGCGAIIMVLTGLVIAYGTHMLH
jgi:lysyl-tRNA synthetase class II